MGNVIDLTDSLERAAARQVAEKLKGMDITSAEHAIAINGAVYRVRSGWHVRDAVGEAVHYARLRQQERQNDWWQIGDFDGTA